MLVGLVERLAVGLAYWLGRRVRRRLRNLGEAFHRTNISQWPRQDNLQRFFWRPGAPAPDRPPAWVRRWGNKIEHPIIRSPTIETTRKPGIAKQIPSMDSRAIWCVRRRHQNTPVSVMTPITNIRNRSWGWWVPRRPWRQGTQSPRVPDDCDRRHHAYVPVSSFRHTLFGRRDHGDHADRRVSSFPRTALEPSLAGSPAMAVGARRQAGRGTAGAVQTPWCARRST